MSRLEEYEVCKRRSHQKSDRSMVTDTLIKWEICRFCETWFRFVTRMEENNVPTE